MTHLVPLPEADERAASPAESVGSDPQISDEPTDGASPVRGRQAIRRLLERRPLTPGDLSLPVLVTPSTDHLDGTPPTVSLRGLPQLVRQARTAGLRSIKLFGVA